jgi:hypothetical protein
MMDTGFFDLETKGDFRRSDLTDPLWTAGEVILSENEVTSEKL